MAHPRVAPLVLSLVVLLAAAACGTSGRNFTYTGIPALDYGSLRSADYEAAFGTPRGVVTKTNADGTFELVRYSYAEAIMGTVNTRLLLLEFRDGSLNAWIHGSTFADDHTDADRSLVAKIRKGVDGKQDVQALLGKPHGKARCPSLLADYKDRCKDSEIWAWSTGTITGPAGRHTMRFGTVYVIFDSSGIVTNVETSETVTNQSR